MAMLHARKAKRDDGVRLPAFVLESDNLDSYRPWLKRLREWTRKQGGRIMEAHLIGEEVPEEDLADAEAAGADADVVGHRTEDGVGVEGGRRRQIRDPATYPVDQRGEAAARCAAAGMETLPVSTIIGMTTAQHARLCGDNEPAVGTINKPGRLSMLSRSIAKDIAVPRDMVARLVMIYMWIKTEFMLADIGTKFVTPTVFNAIVPCMRGIRPIIPSFGTNPKKRQRQTE